MLGLVLGKIISAVGWVGGRWQVGEAGGKEVGSGEWLLGASEASVGILAIPPTQEQQISSSVRSKIQSWVTEWSLAELRSDPRATNGQYSVPFRRHLPDC